VRRASLIAIVAAISLAGVRLALALPPFEVVMAGLTELRSSTGDVVGRGRLTYGDWVDAEVTLQRDWNQPPRLIVGSVELEADWRRPEADMALRLLGAALAAEDLAEAIRATGRSLEPRVQTLVLVDGQPAYLVGGAPDSLAARLTIDRETFRLLAIDLSMPDGAYRVVLADYDLAAGWSPALIQVWREDRCLLELRLDQVEPRR
jgi:hypothetical protein